jgi:Domain of Unknown Function with PDB structure (DUF3857)/Transglutaminase-like superfamily
MKAALGARAIVMACAATAMTCPAIAGMPDWAKAAAEAAPPVPEGMPEWPERTLLAETSTVVSDDGATWRVTRRKVSQILSARVESTNFGAFGFDDTTKIKKSKGWHLPPGEHARRDYGGALDLSLSNDFLNDDKVRFIALEGVRKGSIVAYEFQAERHPYTLTAVEPFFDGVPVSVARWSIELPAGWTLQYAWLPSGGPEPAHAGTTWTFEQRELDPAHDDPMGEPPNHVAPCLVVALRPPAGTSTATPAFAGWDALGRWFHDLAKDRDAATPAIQAATREVLAKAGPAPLDRIRALSLFVRDRVRYVAREVGIGGYQPRPASQVLTELYGDCKDKGTLLRAALQTAGFTAYPILIHATNPHSVASSVPAPGSFNHFVIGVLWPKDAAFPDEAASARVDAGDAGTLLVVDPTDEAAWPGTLPANLAGKTAVVIVGDRGVLYTLPDGGPRDHRIVRAATATLAADRSLAVQLTSKMYGGPAEDARRANAVSFKGRRDEVEHRWQSVWPGAAIKDYTVVAEDADGAYVETVSLQLPAGAHAPENDTYWLFAGVTGDIERVPLAKRKTPVQYPYPFELRYDVTLTGALPEQMLPEPVKLSGAAWSVESAFRRDGGAVHGTWTADLIRAHFEPGDFSELKQFWSAAGKAAAPGMTLAH